jgi:hypothetical protein
LPFSAAQTFEPFHADNMSQSDPIDPNELLVLRSNKTGRYCRLSDLPTEPTMQHMVCDVERITDASEFYYTGVHGQRLQAG